MKSQVPSILFSGALVLLAWAIAAASNPHTGFCVQGESPWICARSWLAALGSLAVAAVIANRQYRESQRQSSASEQQAVWAKIQLIEGRLLSFQMYAEFMSRTADRQTTRAITDLGKALIAGEPDHIISSRCGFVAEWSERAHQAAVVFSDKLVQYVFDRRLIDLLPMMVEMGQRWDAATSRVAFSVNASQKRPRTNSVTKAASLKCKI